MVEVDNTHWVKPVAPNNDYPDKFNLSCIQSIAELKQTFEKHVRPDGTYPMMGFDTETTGLNPEIDSIVGYSFGFNEVDAYYVPLDHVSFGLGDEALDICYSVMTKCDLVLAFNWRFDFRMMEWHKFENEMEDFRRDFISKNRPFYRYDMSKVKIYDIQVLVWATYTQHYYPKLKWAELQFLGWRSQTFSETQGSAGNFAYLDPLDPNTYKYAATDALALILLYKKLKWMRDEGKLSVQMHASDKLVPLTRFEQTPLLADLDLLRKQQEYFTKKLQDIERECYKITGYQFNISSGPEKAKAFQSKNIILSARTASGKVSTDSYALESAMRSYEKDSEQYKLMALTIDYLHVKKMLSTYVDSLLTQAESNELNPGLFRYSYRNVATTSGRYSGGTYEQRA